MGNIPVYSSQIGSTGAIPQPQANPEDFGAGIGQALRGLGQQFVGLASDIKAHDQRADNISSSLALSKARLDLTRTLIQMQDDAEAGAPGFTEKFFSTFDEYAANALDTIPAGKPRDAFNVGIASLRTDLGVKASTFAAGSAANKQTADAHASLSAGINTILTDPTQYDAAVAEGQKLIVGLGINGDDRQALITDFVNSATAARFKGLLDAAKTPDAVAGVIHDLQIGDWKKIMGDKAYEDLLGVAQRAENSMRTLLKQEATAAVDGLKERIEGGAQIDPEELAQVTAQVKDAADAKLLHDFTKLRVEYDTRQKVTRFSTEDLKAYGDGKSIGAFDTLGSIPADTSGRASLARDLFVRLGYTPEQAAGIVGNLIQESNLNSSNTTGDGGKSHGMAQWNGERLTLLKRFAAARGKTWDDFGTQIAFIDWELKNREPNAYAALKNATSVEAATKAFIGFERPRGWLPNRPEGGDAYDKRLAYATQTYGGAPTPSEFDWTRAATAQKVLNERNARISAGDTMGAFYASQNRTAGPLNTPDDFRERAGDAAVAAAYFGTENKPFTPPEVEAFKKVVEDGTVDQKLALLDSISSMGAGAPAGFKQIGEKDSLFDFVGGLNGTDSGVAHDVIRGQDKLQKSPTDYAKVLNTGSDGGTAAVFASVVGNAFQSAHPEDAGAIRKAADALYVQRVGLAGSGDFQDDKYRQAVRDVLGAAGKSDGGVATINGEPTALPPGVSGDEFRTMLNKLAPGDLVEHSVGNGPPRYAGGDVAPPDEIAREGRFRSIGAGAYAIEMADGLMLDGTGPNGRYVFQIDAKGVQEIVGRADPVPDVNDLRAIHSGGNSGVPGEPPKPEIKLAPPSPAIQSVPANPFTGAPGTPSLGGNPFGATLNGKSLFK